MLGHHLCIKSCTFITEWGTYCYKQCDLGQRMQGPALTKEPQLHCFNMMYRDVEVYLHDMIVLKSRDRGDHLTALERFLERIRRLISDCAEVSVKLSLMGWKKNQGNMVWCKDNTEIQHEGDQNRSSIANKNTGKQVSRGRRNTRPVHEHGIAWCCWI